MQRLQLYNSLSNSKEVFNPIYYPPSLRRPVTMYSCGPTVYSQAHIGNARAAVTADVLYRLLISLYGKVGVKYARNITDVDDKIIAASKEQSVCMKVITDKYAKVYNDDLRSLNCLSPDFEPRATDNIYEIVHMISDLVDGGYAYLSENHVFFDVSKYEEYGALSRNNLKTLGKAKRTSEEEYSIKRNPHDFVLWKPSYADDIGWDSDFGYGRPGWHIECSAMVKSTLGDTIDIHCGGVDLKFPHHENEIAQSYCANKKKMANYWVHNEYVLFDKEKMSKSDGNTVLISDLVEKWGGLTVRLALLKTHYRKELNWAESRLIESQKFMEKLAAGKVKMQDDNMQMLYNDMNIAGFLAKPCERGLKTLGLLT